MAEENFYLYIDGQRVKVSEEVYREYYRGERKERYFMEDLKKEHIFIDSETQAVTVIPSREVSYEHLEAFGEQFGADEMLEESVVRSVLLKSALQTLSSDEQTLIQELYFLEKTERQVSEALHMAKTTLRRRHQKVLDKLKELLEEKK